RLAIRKPCCLAHLLSTSIRPEARLWRWPGSLGLHQAGAGIRRLLGIAFESHCGVLFVRTNSGYSCTAHRAVTASRLLHWLARGRLGPPIAPVRAPGVP